MHKLNFSMAFLLAAIVLITCSVAFGQETTGSIEGSVKDSAGALVPNLTITITNAKAAASGTTTTGIGAGFKRTTTTNDEGFFRILQVPPGTYDVVTTASSGFGEARYENVTVAIGQSSQLAVTVNPGSNVTIVDIVAADALPVDTTNSAIQTTISAQKIELIPKSTGFYRPSKDCTRYASRKPVRRIFGRRFLGRRKRFCYRWPGSNELSHRHSERDLQRPNSARSGSSS